MTTLECPIAQFASQSPDHLALQSQDQTLTYAELDKWISSTVALLQKTPQRIVAFMPSEPIKSIVFIWACIRAHKLCFPINPKFTHEYTSVFLKEAEIEELTDIDTFTSGNIQITTPSTLNTKQLCTVLATSGSSGMPKLAVHTLGNHLANAMASQATIPLHYPDKWKLTLPLFHVSGLSLLFRCFSSGAAIVVGGETEYTHISMVPTQLQQVLRSQDQHFRSSHYCLVGGSAIPPSIIKEAPNTIKYIPTYGLTEMSSQVITNNTTLNSASLIVSPSNQLLVKGKSLFKGYLKQGVIHRELTADGYFQTGDLATYKKGSFNYIGRKDRLIISGGENIQPEEIENIILQHPEINKCAVIGVHHDVYGQRPIAFIAAENFTNTRSDLQGILSKLPSFKQPDAIYKLPDTLISQKISYNFLYTYAKNTLNY